MDNGGDQDKSEQATPFKLKKAREKGSIARSMDLAFAAGLAGFLGYAWSAGDSLVATMGQATRQTLVSGPQVMGEPGGLYLLVSLLFASMARPLAMMATTIFLIVLLLELVQTGIIFTAHPLKPDFSRINPAKGLKRLFSWPMLLNAAKNVFKMAVYATVAWLAIRHSYSQFAPTIVDARSLVQALGASSLRLMLCFLGVAVAFAALDQILVRRSFAKQMRMSRRDVRRESRDREGEPRLKQKRKGLHAEFVRNAKSMRALPSADLLVVNPIHYAVGLRYVPAEMVAPIVVAQGSHSLARRLKKLAFLYHVPVIEDPVLARALFRGSVIDRPIAESHYHDVAAHYRALRAQRGREVQA